MNPNEVPLPLLLAAETSILVPGLYLGGALLVGAFLIMMVQRWRRRARSEALSASDQLAHFRSLYEQGAISEEEFNQLRSLLGGELRRSLKVPPTPQAADNAPPRPAPPREGQEPTDGIRPA